jgi:autoinducer 2-degrading protein
MYVVSVTVFVKPQFVERFIAASLENARGTRREPGNLRFDISQGEEERNRFLLYEVYRTKEDLVRHQQTPHYLRWRETVAEWMEKPRMGVRHLSVFFPESEGGELY